MLGAVLCMGRWQMQTARGTTGPGPSALYFDFAAVGRPWGIRLRMLSPA